MTGRIIKSNENVKVVIIQIPTCTRIEPQMLHNAMFTTITCQKTFCEGSCWVWINHSHLTSLVKVHMEQRLGNCVWPSWKNISKCPLATFLKELRCQIFDVWMIHYFLALKSNCGLINISRFKTWKKQKQINNHKKSEAMISHSFDINVSTWR